MIRRKPGKEFAASVLFGALLFVRSDGYGPEKSHLFSGGPWDIDSG